MIDDTMPSLASQPQRTSPLQLPLQAAPIDRSQLPASGVTSDGGVEAAAWWNDVLDVVKTVGGVAGPLIAGMSDRRLKRDIIPVEWSR